ncbi:MAG: alkaline shock response membrane anchor protein AmaP [Clostridia bacterium]|nr:alkaline shock response membrane anchor protein AmaP [Candidatus Pelethousia sp.]NCB30434.1 alkaline shock response membrane anchor protein AmaP [Clostridia bacterium]
MKPSYFDRFLLVICSLVGMAAGVALLLLSVGIFSLEVARAMVDGYAAQVGNLNFRLILGAAGLVVFLVSFRLIVGFNSRRGKAEKAPAATATTINSGDYGTIQITLAAIDSMVQRHCRANSKVREVTSAVSTRESGVAISLKLVLLSEANVPEVTAELQKSLKEYIEGLTGITVNDISIMVVCAPTQQLQQR